MTHNAEKDAGRCTAFALDTVCPASDPCPVHGCNDVDNGVDEEGCYCDPERVLPPAEGHG